MKVNLLSSDVVKVETLYLYRPFLVQRIYSRYYVSWLNKKYASTGEERLLRDLKDLSQTKYYQIPPVEFKDFLDCLEYVKRMESFCREFERLEIGLQDVSVLEQASNKELNNL